MKRILSLILIFLLVPTVSFAEETLTLTDISSPTEISLEENAPTFRTGGVSFELDKLQCEPENALVLPNFFAEVPFGEILMASMEVYIEETNTLPTGINVEGRGITLENIEEMYFAPVVRNPQLLLHTGIRYYDPEGDGVIEAIEPMFLVDDIDEFKTARQDMYAGMQKYLTVAAEYDDPVEKLLAVHDKMVELCQYDHRVMSPDPEIEAQAPKTVYHALGVFRDSFAVCQGYSQAMYMLGKEIGIEIELCQSEEANHMWNYVKLDDKWYYMDMTNDDPQDAQGRAAHTFFLFSENKLHPQAHGSDYSLYGSGEVLVCNDTKYDSNHFFNMTILFSGYKDEDGYYNASINYKINSVEIDAVATFKSDSLYVGPVVVAPMIAEGNVTVIKDGQTTQVRSRNLYMLEYSFGNVGKTFPIIRRGNEYLVLQAREAMDENTVYRRVVFTNVPEVIDLTQFTSFVFDDNFTPYGIKLNWK